LPEKSSRLFEVVCKDCRRLLMTVERLRDPEISLLTSHLRACSPSEPLEEAPMLGEIMRRLHVRRSAADLDGEDPADLAV